MVKQGIISNAEYLKFETKPDLITDTMIHGAEAWVKADAKYKTQLAFMAQVSSEAGAAIGEKREALMQQIKENPEKFKRMYAEFQQKSQAELNKYGQIADALFGNVIPGR